MNDPHDFDDNATDALLSGGGRDVDPRLADLLSDMRTAYTSTPPAIGLELSALLEGTRSTPARSFLSRRFEQMRASMLAKIGVGAVAAVAATGGLAAAGALPSRVKDAVSHLGITTPSRHSSDSPSAKDSTTTTTAKPTDSYGHDVSRVVHDPGSDGCEHGVAVSSVSASDSNRGTCETTTTIANGATPATTNGGGDNGDGTPTTTTEPDTAPTDPNESRGDSSDGTTPTTVETDTTPTTVSDSGADPTPNESGASPAVDTNPSLDDTSTSTPGGAD